MLFLDSFVLQEKNGKVCQGLHPDQASASTGEQEMVDVNICNFLY